MGFGNQSRALIIASKAQGYDPTRIMDTSTGEYAESVANFDKDPADPYTHKTTGDLPRSVGDQRTLAADAETPWNHRAQRVNDRHLEHEPQGVPAPEALRGIAPSAIAGRDWNAPRSRMAIPPVGGA